MSNKSLFESKQHYVDFRNAWAAAVTDPRAKRTIKHHRYPIQYYEHGTLVVTEHNGAEVIPGWITSTHALLYNLLRDKPFYNGFTPVSNRNKLTNSTYVNWSLYLAAYNLDWRKRQAIESLKKDPIINQDSSKQYWGTTTTMTFLEPFNGTITREMLSELVIPEIKIISIDDVKGIRYMVRLSNHETPTYADIYGGDNENN